MKTPVGRADQLAPHLSKIIAALRPYARERVLTPQQLRAAWGLTYGPVLVARRLWDQLGLGEIVTRRCRPLGGLDVPDAAFVLTAHRLVHPGSEHALPWWLEGSAGISEFAIDQPPCHQIAVRTPEYSGDLLQVRVDSPLLAELS